jgi:hypothetical protein
MGVFGVAPKPPHQTRPTIYRGLLNVRSFLALFFKLAFMKTIQNQREHTIDPVIVIVCFLDSKPYAPLHIPLSRYLDSSHSRFFFKKKTG